MCTSIIRSFNDKKVLNICVCQQQFTDKLAVFLEQLNLSRMEVDLTTSDAFDSIKNLKNKTKDSLIYINGLEKVNILKQIIVMPFLDGSIKRDNSICVVVVDDNIVLSQTIMHKFDLIIK